MTNPLRVGIIGMGGFAGSHHNAVLELERAGECRLICACDPNMNAFKERQQTLQFPARGIRLFTDYIAMLDACRTDLDVVTVPTPIPLHAPMHRACVERGLPVYLEKPPTLVYTEMDDMLAMEAKASRLTNVGFVSLADVTRHQVKQRVLDGEFGALRRVGVSALWARGRKYYTRAGWAGRLLLNDQLVLDSCMGNALAHYAHNGLFWGGTDGLWAWGRPVSVEAELYRAHAIESTDTMFIQARLEQGIDLRIALTHACDPIQLWGPEECLECERATLTWRRAEDGCHIIIAWRDRPAENLPPYKSGGLPDHLRAYFRYLRGETTRPLTRLVDARPFVILNDLAYVAARHITTISALNVERVQDAARADEFLRIRDMPEIIRRFVQTGIWPSAQGLPWAAPGGRATPADLPRLQEVVKQLIIPE